jgi:hypothetical protein
MSNRLLDNAADMFVAELSRIDNLGANQRLIFTLPSIDNDGYSQVQIKLIVPTDYMDQLGSLILGRARDDARDNLLSRFETRSKAN